MKLSLFLFFNVFILVVTILTIGCKKKSENKKNNSDDQLEIGTIEEIKGVTDLVTEFSSADKSDAASEASAFDNLQIDDAGLVATTGVSIGSSTSDIKSAFGTTVAKLIAKRSIKA